MSNIWPRATKSGEVRWHARFRDPEGKQRSRSFPRKVDAANFLTGIDSAKLSGSYVDPKQSARTFGDFAEEHWIGYSHNLAADTTRVVKRSRLDRHILPVLGHYRVGAIKPSTMAAAVATWSRTLQPGTVGQVLRQVRQILDAALADGMVSTNVAKAVKAPTAPRRRAVNLSDDEVRKVVAAAPDHYRAFVLTLAATGLRVSEACGLTLGDVDFLRRTVHVRRQLRPGGDLGRVKTADSVREVPASDAVLELLAETIRLHPRADGLVFSSVTGRTVTKSVAGHVFDGIEAATGVTVSPHSCRHYFGASLISRGVSVVAVSKWLGHSSPDITWRVYSYLMPDDEVVGRGVMADVMAALSSDVHAPCTREAVE